MNQTLEFTKPKIKHNNSNIENQALEVTHINQPCKFLNLEVSQWSNIEDQPYESNIIHLTTNQTPKMEIVAAVLVCSLHKSRGEDSCFSCYRAALRHEPKCYLPYAILLVAHRHLNSLQYSPRLARTSALHIFVFRWERRRNHYSFPRSVVLVVHLTGHLTGVFLRWCCTVLHCSLLKITSLSALRLSTFSQFLPLRTVPHWGVGRVTRHSSWFGWFWGRYLTCIFLIKESTTTTWRPADAQLLVPNWSSPIVPLSRDKGFPCKSVNVAILTRRAWLMTRGTRTCSFQAILRLKPKWIMYQWKFSQTK